jgi:hypothetical protein
MLRMDGGVVGGDDGQMLVEVEERGRVKFFGWTSEEKRQEKKNKIKKYKKLVLF